LSILQIRPPFLSLPCESVERKVPLSFEVPSSGFGYPLGGVSSHIPGSLFQLPTLLGFALQSFAPVKCRKDSFKSLLSFWRFPGKPLGFPLALQRFPPLHQPCSSLLPEGLVQVGTVALLSFLNLSGFLSQKHNEKAFSSLSRFPFWPLSPSDFTIRSSGPLRSCHFWARRLPFQDAGLLGFLYRSPLRPLRILALPRTIFSSRSLLFLTKLHRFSLRTI